MLPLQKEREEEQVEEEEQVPFGDQQMSPDQGRNVKNVEV